MKIVLLSFFLYLSSFQTNLWAQVDLKPEKKVETTKKIIIVYGSANCHYCTDAKNELIKNKIEFIFYDIDTDKIALNEMLNKLRNAKISTNNLGIPVIDKYGELFSNNTTFDDFLKKLIP